MRTTKRTEQTTCTHSMDFLSLYFARSLTGGRVCTAIQAFAAYNATKTMGKKFNCTGVADADADAAAAIPIYILSNFLYLAFRVPSCALSKI